MNLLPTFDEPLGALPEEREHTDGQGVLGHACGGSMIKTCSKIWVFNPEQLKKHNLTQIEALELKCCAICTAPPRALTPEKQTKLEKGRKERVHG